MILHSRYAPPPSIGIDEFDDTQTQQHFKNECDVNYILERHGVTSLSERSGAFYADVSDIRDFRDAIDRVNSANEQFLQLPATTRSVFGNDPATFLDFVLDPSNASELPGLGLTEVRTSSPLDVTGTTDTSTAVNGKELKK